MPSSPLTYTAASGRPGRLEKVAVTHMDALLGIAGNSAIKTPSASSEIMSMLYHRDNGHAGSHHDGGLGGLDRHPHDVAVGALRVLQAASGALYVGASSPDPTAASALIGMETPSHHVRSTQDNHEDNTALTIQYQVGLCDVCNPTRLTRTAVMEIARVVVRRHSRVGWHLGNGLFPFSRSAPLISLDCPTVNT